MKENHSRKHGFPAVILQRFAQKGYINLPFEPGDEERLALMQRLSRDTVFLQQSLKHFSYKQREGMIAKAGMNRVEKWVFSRYCNAHDNGKRLRTREIARGVMKTFHHLKKAEAYEAIKKTRKRFYNWKQRRDNNNNKWLDK